MKEAGEHRRFLDSRAVLANRKSIIGPRSAHQSEKSETRMYLRDQGTHQAFLRFTTMPKRYTLQNSFVPPAFITKEQAVFILGSSAFLKRAMHANLLKVIRQGGRGCSTLLDYASVLKVADFNRAGGQLPLLPSETPRLDRKAQARAA